MSIALEEIVVRHTHRIPVPESPSVRGIAVRTLATVREMAGDHVRHNTCFRDFPRNVPDTFDSGRASCGRRCATRSRRAARSRR
ncbi:hypothetical protein [Actinomadura chokoriensis]|uniref:hypothetical protein n=1 Tax=Actinomadura chokoriensis TaxID=454156 RepID=UPI0031F90AD4